MTPTARTPDPHPPARASARWLYGFLLFQFICQAAMILAPVGGLRQFLLDHPVVAVNLVPEIARRFRSVITQRS